MDSYEIQYVGVSGVRLLADEIQALAGFGWEICGATQTVIPGDAGVRVFVVVMSTSDAEPEVELSPSFDLEVPVGITPTPSSWWERCWWRFKIALGVAG